MELIIPLVSSRLNSMCPFPPPIYRKRTFSEASQILLLCKMYVYIKYDFISFSVHFRISLFFCPKDTLTLLPDRDGLFVGEFSADLSNVNYRAD